MSSSYFVVRMIPFQNAYKRDGATASVDIELMCIHELWANL